VSASFHFIAFYLIAFHLCFATLLIASYLPGYAFFFPLILLLIPLIILIGNVTSHLSSGFPRKALTGIVFVLVGFILYRNILENSVIHKLAVDNNIRRKNIFERVYSLSKENGSEKYILINCPLAYPKFGWTMEPPWGISGYFTWRGNEKITVFLKGNADTPDNWEDGTYTLISCKDP
jgi:hypothetical protein